MVCPQQRHYSGSVKSDATIAEGRGEIKTYAKRLQPLTRERAARKTSNLDNFSIWRERSINQSF